MMRKLCWALLALCLAARALAIDPAELPDPQLQARYETLIHELRCMQCQNEAIADSPVDLAGDLRRQVRDMLMAGKSDAEIKQYMVDRYSDFILFKPRFAAKTAWLWAAPFVLLLIGGFVAYRVVSRRSRLLDSDLEPVDEDMEESAPPR